MTQKTGRFGASGREFCLYSLEKEDIEETLQLMDRCVGENLYQKEELEQAIGSSERAFLLLRTAEGELAGYKIPDTIPVVRDGKKMVMTKADFKNYISRPVDANGYTQYELDEMKRDQNSIIEDDLLRAYLRFTGGDYSSLVGMAINKEKVNKLRIAADKASKRTLVINSKKNDSKGKIDNNELILE